MADYQYVQTTGVVIPDTADTQALVEQEFRDAFGQDLVVTANTPQGVLITAEVTARQAVARNNAALANQINPNLAGGVFLDAIWALTGGSRNAASKSSIPGVLLAGVAGTLIPAGSKAATGAGDVFVSASDVVLDAGGNGSCEFIAEEYGPVPANALTLLSVVSAVLGWETVENPDGATLGQLEESDVASRLRRSVTLALQGVALPEAIVSGLYDVDGVRSLTFRENVTDGVLVIDGVNLGAHSVYACVDGGADADVAAALLAKKSLGAGWNGGTIVNVTEPASGQVYAVKFDRPTLVPVLVSVTVRDSTAIADIVNTVKDAIMTYVNGQLDGETGFAVGGAVSPFEIAGAINQQYPSVYVRQVLVTLASVVNPQPVEIPMLIYQLATLQRSDIGVAVA